MGDQSPFFSFTFAYCFLLSPLLLLFRFSFILFVVSWLSSPFAPQALPLQSHEGEGKGRKGNGKKISSWRAPAIII